MSSPSVDFGSLFESRGKKRSRSKCTEDRPRKRQRREHSTASIQASIGPSMPHASSRLTREPSRPRYIGDGLDYRRPAASSGSRNNPIDLSDSESVPEPLDDGIAFLGPPSRPASIPPPLTQRPPPPGRPRFSRPIINLDDDQNQGRQEQLDQHERASDGPQQNPTTHQLPPISNLTRTLPPLPPIDPRRRIPVTRENGNRTAGSRPPADAHVYVIDDDDGDESGLIVEDGQGNRIADGDDVGAQVRQNMAAGRPVFTGLNIPAASRALALMRNLGNLRGRAGAVPRRGGLMAPFLNYAQQGFNYLGGAAVSPPPGVPPPPPPPSYGELPPCPDGFTRSPREEDYLICPRCRRELCISDNVADESPGSGSVKGKDKRTKRDENIEEGREELWVVRACEHVYCGSCARSRPAKAPTKKQTAAAKGKQKETSEPFTHCMVEDCGEKVTGKATMIQCWL